MKSQKLLLATKTSALKALFSHNSRLRAGLHLEGPFISVKKRGAHPEQFLRTFRSGGIKDLMEVYGSLDNVALVTLAPELEHSQSVVRELSQRGITVSLGKHVLTCVCDSEHMTLHTWPLTPIQGHSVANLSQAEEAVQHGASFITHLFNAMPSVSPSRTSCSLHPSRIALYYPPPPPGGGTVLLQLLFFSLLCLVRWCSSTIGTLVSWVCWPAIRSQQGGPCTTAWSLTGSTPTQQPCGSPTGRTLQVGAAGSILLWNELFEAVYVEESRCCCRGQVWCWWQTPSRRWGSLLVATRSDSRSSRFRVSTPTWQVCFTWKTLFISNDPVLCFTCGLKSF